MFFIFSFFSIKSESRIKYFLFLSNDKNQKHSATNYRTSSIEIAATSTIIEYIHDEQQLDSRSPSSALFKEILISESFNVNIKNVIPFYLFMSEEREAAEIFNWLLTCSTPTYACLSVCLFGSMPAYRQLSFHWMNLFSSSVCNFTVNIVSWNLCTERYCMD